MSKAPKSMVIRVGASQVGSSVTQLVKDVRLMMEPDTAVRLKVCQFFWRSSFWFPMLIRTGTQIQ